MNISFSKMHGLGNDFVVIDAINQKFDAKKIPVAKLAHRQLGLGFDQMLLIEPSNNADFYCKIFNSDGSEAEQCGNGLRCVAQFLKDHHFISKPQFTIETKGGIFDVSMLENNHIQISMGLPCFTPAEIPFVATEEKKQYPITLANGSIVEATVLNIGNPHAIIRVNSIAATPVTELGEELATHSLFPQGANIGFMEVVNRHHVRLRTFERGAGETFACGSNACAAAVTGILNGWLDKEVNVEFCYGSLQVEWEGLNHPIIMRGPATLNFKGEFALAT